MRSRIKYIVTIGASILLLCLAVWTYFQKRLPEPQPLFMPEAQEEIMLDDDDAQETILLDDDE